MHRNSDVQAVGYTPEKVADLISKLTAFPNTY